MFKIKVKIMSKTDLPHGQVFWKFHTTDFFSSLLIKKWALKKLGQDGTRKYFGSVSHHVRKVYLRRELHVFKCKHISNRLVSRDEKQTHYAIHLTLNGIFE